MLWLWSDRLFWLLMALMLFSIWRSCQHDYWRMVWRQVCCRPLAMVCMVILLFFLALTTLDSIHFSGPAHHGVVSSLLDRMLTTSSMLQKEESYSKPMATHLSVLMAVPSAAKDSHGYAHLSSVPSHLNAGELVYYHDMAWLIAWGLLTGLVLAMLATGLIVALLAFKKRCGWLQAFNDIAHGKTHLAWRSGLITLFILIGLSGVIFQLATHYHIMGTDKIGRDVLYMALKSVRTAVLIGSLTTLLMLPFAMFFGLMAGFMGGWVDDVVQYVYTTISSIPSVLLISAMVLVMQVYIDRHPMAFPTGIARADMKFIVLCAVLGLTSWTQLCRLLRAEAMKLRELDYIHFAVMIRVRSLKILFRHMMPNVMHIVLINIILDFSGLVLAESVLSYVGVGVDSSLYSWGNMMNAARLELSREPTVWWPLITVLVLMLTLVLAVNCLADVVRDALDPHETQLSELAHE